MVPNPLFSAQDFLAQRLLDHLDQGHQAASIACHEVDGKLVWQEHIDMEVELVIDFTGPDGCSHENESVSLLPLLSALRLGLNVSRISRPDPSMLFWEAIACHPVILPAAHPASIPKGLWVPPVFQVIGCQTYDGRGAIAAPFSRLLVGGDYFGKALTRALTRSKIAGVTDRFDRSLRKLGHDLGPEFLESAAPTFAAESALTDTLNFWGFSASALTRGSSRSIADLGEAVDPGARARINGRLLELLEREAFGYGVHSPRAKGKVFSLDSEPVYPEPDSQSPSLATGIEPASYLDRHRSRLTVRQQEIVDLLVEGYNQTEVAAKLGISQPAVSESLAAVRRNLLSDPL